MAQLKLAVDEGGSVETTTQTETKTGTRTEAMMLERRRERDLGSMKVRFHCM